MKLSIPAEQLIASIEQWQMDWPDMAADPRHLGARLGFVAVLHTWGQDLHYHPHLHVVATGGGTR